MTTMDWLTIIIAAAGGLGGAGLAHGLARGQISALHEECRRMWSAMNEIKRDNKEEIREIRKRQDRRINGNGNTHD